MLALVSFLIGLLAGLAIRRRWQPLMLERIRALSLVVLLFLAGLLPWLFAKVWPNTLWTDDRSLLIALLILPLLMGLFLIVLNILPARFLDASRPPVHWYHRAALAVVAAGILAEGAVLLANHGYMPVSVAYLNDIKDPMMAEAIRSGALLMKKLASSDTLLTGLGQVWRCDLLANLHLIPLPYISLGETLMASGLFLTGLSQFFGGQQV